MSLNKNYQKDNKHSSDIATWYGICPAALREGQEQHPYNITFYPFQSSLMQSSEYLQKLEDPLYLPSRDEISLECIKWLSRILQRYDRKSWKIWYEIITKDLIEWLSKHLGAHATWETAIKIVEVWAGNGKLARFLNASLQKSYPHVFDYHAVDNQDEDWSNISPIVENMAMQEAVDTYKPQIIIASRLKMHPFNLLPNWFLPRMTELVNKYSSKNISNQEKEERSNLSKLWIEKDNGPDITHYRRQYPTLKEYILIWPVGSVWDDRCIKKIYWCENHFDDFLDLDDFKDLPNPSFAADWFKKTKLSIFTMNKVTAMYGFRNREDYSEVYSFKRDEKI